MRHLAYSVLFVLSLTVVLSGCKDDPVTPAPTPTPTLLNAVYVLNEGNFGDATGARLTAYDLDQDSAYRDVFEAANRGQHLGSLGDDMKLHNGKAYILMSGSENLVVMNLSNHTLAQSAGFAGDTPNYMVIDSARGKVYICRLFKNSLLVVNLSTLVVIDSIPVGNNPQSMLLHGKDLYVCNGGFGSDRTVSVVDVLGDSVRATITVSDGPSSSLIASDGNIWIACTGNAFGIPATPGKIFIVDPTTLAIEDSISFSENLWGSLVQGIDGNAYVVGANPASFYGGAIHRIAVATKAVTLNFIATDIYYAMSIDPTSGDLFLTDAKNFASNGVISIYNKGGVFKKSFAAQKGPASIVFKH